MPGTIRGFLQGLAYALPKVSEILEQDQLMMMNREQLDMQKTRIELEKKRFDLEKTMYEEITLPEAKQRGELIDINIENAGLLLGIDKEFAREAKQLDMNLKRMDEAQRKQTDPLTVKALQQSLDESKVRMDEMKEQIEGIKIDNTYKEANGFQTLLLNKINLVRATYGMPEEVLNMATKGESAAAIMDNLINNPSITQDHKNALMGIKEPLMEIEMRMGEYMTSAELAYIQGQEGDVNEEELETFRTYTAQNARRIYGGAWLTITGQMTAEENRQKAEFERQQKEEAERLRKQQEQRTQSPFYLGELKPGTPPSPSNFLKSIPAGMNIYGNQVPGVR